MAIDPITAGIEAASKIIDKFFPDKAAADTAKLELLRMQQAGELEHLQADTELAKGQQAVNQAEAASGDKFASRWRPFVGWVCGIAFAYHFVLQPAIAFGCAMLGTDVTLPTFDMEALNTVLFGMLGFGGLRTVEKIRR